MGIPPALRKKVWMHYSGADRLLQENMSLYKILGFKEIQDRQMGYSTQDNAILRFIHQIDQDLKRTFPNNIYFQSNGTSNIYLSTLRKILVAFAYYSWPHPNPSIMLARRCSYKIGYCQSLNFLVGLLILVFTYGDSEFSGRSEDVLLEEQIFWMLICIIEKLLPDEYYGQNLKGIHVEQQILWKHLLATKGSKLASENVNLWLEATSQGMPTNPALTSVTSEWFLSLYVNSLPFNVTINTLIS
jgi:hypothetical protein